MALKRGQTSNLSFTLTEPSVMLAMSRADVAWQPVAQTQQVVLGPFRFGRSHNPTKRSLCWSSTLRLETTPPASRYPCLGLRARVLCVTSGHRKIWAALPQAILPLIPFRRWIRGSTFFGPREILPFYGPDCPVCLMPKHSHHRRTSWPLLQTYLNVCLRVTFDEW